MCLFCDYPEEETECRHVSPFGLVCTRQKGHEGSHVACTIDAHELARWGNNEGPRFSVVIVTQDGKRRAVGCSTRTVEFVKEANPAAESFEVLPLEAFWSMAASYPPNGWEDSEHDG